MCGDPHSALPSIEMPPGPDTAVSATGLRRKLSHGIGFEGHSTVRALLAFMNCQNTQQGACPAGSSAIKEVAFPTLHTFRLSCNHDSGPAASGAASPMD